MISKTKKRLAIGLIILVVTALVISALVVELPKIKKREREPLPLEEFFSLPSISGMRVSWDKEEVGFYWDKSGRNELYLLDLNTRDIEQVTHGELPKFIRAGFIWGRTNSKLIFMKDETGNEQHDLRLIDLENNEFSQLTSTPAAQEIAIEFSPDNKRVTFCSTRNGQMNLFKLRINDSEITQLTYHEQPVWGGSWQPKGDWIAYCANEMKDNFHNQDIYLVKQDGCELKRIIRMSEDGSQDIFGDWSPDGKLFSFSSDISGLNQVGIYLIKSGEIRWLSNGLWDEQGGEFSPDGKSVLCIRNREATLSPVIYNLKSGECKELKLPAGISVATFALDSNHLLIVQTTPITRLELLLYDLKNDTYEVLIPAEYGSIDPARFAEPAYIRYESFDGLEIPAILYSPKEIKEWEKPPAFIMPHGGPTAQYFLGFDPIASILLAKVM